MKRGDGTLILQESIGAIQQVRVREEKEHIYRKCVLVFDLMSGGGRVGLQSMQNLYSLSVSLPAS